jgi:hypothetical protein
MLMQLPQGGDQQIDASMNCFSTPSVGSVSWPWSAGRSSGQGLYYY